MALKSCFRSLTSCHVSPLSEKASILLRNASSDACHGPKFVETQKVGHTFMIGIDRPEKRNCVNQATATELMSAFKELESREDLHVGVLYGKGGTFCAGYDLEEISKFDPNSDHPLSELNVQNPGDWRPMGPSMLCRSKPLIAAISGHAVAGGLELALLCDLRIVEESAIMGVFCRRFGVPLIDGGTVRLPALIGLSRALDLILTGRGVTASEAHSMGLANRVAPDGTAVGEALKLASTISQFPQKCMRADRLSAHYVTYDAKSYEDAFDFEWKNGHKVFLEESVHGARKFQAGEGRHGKFVRPEKSKL